MITGIPHCGWRVMVGRSLNLNAGASESRNRCAMVASIRLVCIPANEAPMQVRYAPPDISPLVPPT
jgi:hypothetical protein